MADLLDASVWLALSVPDHVHHRRARSYWESEAAAEVAFCRITALALPRLLTNSAVLGRRALEGYEAWKVLEAWLALPGVGWRDEPSQVDEFLRAWAVNMHLRGGDWTDAYLAAFSIAANCRLVSFDRGFRRFSGVTALLLTP